MTCRTKKASISVPLDLKQEMESLNGEVNWSHVACRAFRQVLEELASTPPTGELFLPASGVVDCSALPGHTGEDRS